MKKPTQDEKKPTEEKALAIAAKEVREEESQPLFSQSIIDVFQTGYVTGMSEAVSLLDEDRGKSDHLKDNG